MNDKNGINVGNKIRKLRMDKGYSQEYMADVLNISQRTYSNMENNKSQISVEVLRKIAKEYGIDIIELLKDDRTIVQNNSSKDSSTGGIIYNHMSEKLIEQFEERIVELKELIKEKDKRIDDLEKRIS